MNGGGVRFSRRAEEDVNEGWVSGVVRRHHDAPPVHPLPNEWNDDYAEDDAYEEEEGKGARDRAPGPAPARSSRVPRAPVELSPPAQAPPETFKQGRWGTSPSGCCGCFGPFPFTGGAFGVSADSARAARVAFFFRLMFPFDVFDVLCRRAGEARVTDP